MPRSVIAGSYGRAGNEETLCRIKLYFIVGGSCELKVLISIGKNGNWSCFSTHCRLGFVPLGVFSRFSFASEV